MVKFERLGEYSHAQVINHLLRVNPHRLLWCEYVKGGVDAGRYRGYDSDGDCYLWNSENGACKIIWWARC